MNDETSQTGSESLTLDQATAAYVSSQQAKEPQGQPEQAVDDEDGILADEELPPDEGEGETEEGNPDDEGQADEQDETEPETEGGRFVAKDGRVRLPDGTVSTVSDLIQGNLRDKDYRQKTMAAAEVQKTFEAQSSTLKQREQQIEAREQFAQSLINAVVPSEAPPRPNPAMTDPNSPHFDIVGYNQQAAAYQNWMDWQGALGNLSQAQQQAQAEAKAEAEKAKHERGNKEWILAQEKVPSLKDEKKARAFVEQSLAWGEANGFTRQEIADEIAVDHRKLLTVRKAMAWDRLQAKKPEVQKKAEGRPAVLRGGKRLNPAEHRARNSSAAVAKAQQSGTVEDAAAAYLATRK